MRKFWLIGAVLVTIATALVAFFELNGRDQIKVDGESHSVETWRSRAEAGDKVAQHVIGDLYRRGEGVTQNASLAFEWERKAAEQGEPRAQLELGQMYRAGYGVERNDVEAVKWLRLAAEQGKTDAAYYLGYIFQSGEQISSKDAQRGNDERKVLVRNPVEAARWYRLAVDHGHTGAMVNLGYLYRQGLGVEKNPAEAVRLFKTAAASVRTNRTDPTPSMAAINLALAYQTGDIVPQDYAAAAQWAEDALASPALPPDLEIAAAGLLASYYSEGRGVAQDLEKAKALKARAAAAVEKLHRQQVPKP